MQYKNDFLKYFETKLTRGAHSGALEASKDDEPSIDIKQPLQSGKAPTG